MKIHNKGYSPSPSGKRGVIILFEPRRIHRLPLLLLIPAKLISKRHAEFAEGAVMVRHVLRLEADAGRDLIRFKDIVAVEVEDGFSIGKAVAQAEIHEAGWRQIVDALSGFGASHACKRQLQVGLCGKSKSIVQHGDSIADAAVEGDVPEV